MATCQYRFAQFMVDAAERRLWHDGLAVEVNARYLDALLLLVREPGVLISKERFFAEVWGGVPVTDEALTQCVRTLRRQLGDSATAPRFIETVPKHGYRFIAQVRHGTEVLDPVSPAAIAQESTHSAIQPLTTAWTQRLLFVATATLGGAAAGLVGGLCYGFLAAQSMEGGAGALSVVLVLMSVCLTVALLGAVGVSAGIALSNSLPLHAGLRSVLGGAVGGLLVGGFVKLLGLDALQLFIGQGPRDLTGASEGLLLGAAVGLSVWWSRYVSPQLKRQLSIAALCGATAAMLIVLLGGRLMGGSLALITANYPDAQLRLLMFAEGMWAPYVSAALEGALFCTFIVGALTWISAPQERRRA